MTGALISLGVILVGLPLLAWWVGGRERWSRRDAEAIRRARVGPWTTFARERGLTWQQANDVQSAVARGQELEDPRLRRAAVEWARHTLERTSLRRRPLLAALFVALAAGVVAATCLAIVGHDLRHVPWTGIVLLPLYVVQGVRIRRNLRRAIALNDDERTDEGTGSPAESGAIDP